MSFFNAEDDNSSACSNINDAIPNLDSISSSPGTVQEDVFKNIFNSCDTNNSGLVPVLILIEFIAPYMQQHISGLKELKNILDPSCLNPSISLQEFCDCMRIWTETFQSNADMSNNNEHNQLTPCKNPFVLPQSTPIPPCETDTENQKGKLFLNLSDSSSFASNEIHIDDYIVLQETIKELQFQNKNLCEEFQNLQTQLSVSEEQNGILRDDLEKTNRKLDSEHQLLIDQIENQMKENEEYKESANTALKQVKELQKELCTIRKENCQLEQTLQQNCVEKQKQEEVVANLHLKLNEAAETVAELKTEVEIRAQEKSSLESVNMQLKEKCAEDKNLIEHYMHKNAQLQGEKRKLEKKVQECFYESTFCKKAVTGDSPNVPPVPSRSPTSCTEKLDFTYGEDDIDQLLSLKDAPSEQSIQRELIIAETHKLEQNDFYSTIENLKDEISQLRSQLKEHSQCSEVIHRHKYNLDFMVSEYEKSKSHAKELLDCNYELNRKMETYKKTGDELKNELLELKYKFDNLLMEKETLQLDLKQMCLENTKSSAENINCSLKLESMSEELQLAKADFVRLKEENEDIYSAKQRLENENAALEQEIRKHAAEYCHLKTELKSCTSKLKTAAKEISEMRNEIVNVQSLGEKKIHALEKLQLETRHKHSSEVQKLKIECDLLRDQLKTKSFEVRELSENLSSVRNREQRLSKDLEALQVLKDFEVLELQDKLERLEHEKEQIGDECSTIQMALHKELSKVVSELQSAKEKVQQKDANEQNLMKEMKILNSDYAAVSAELLDLKDARRYESDIEKTLIDTKEFFSAELAASKEELNALKSELDAKRNEIVELITNVNNLGETNLNLQTKNTSLERTNQNCTKEIERLRTKCSKLQSELAAVAIDFDQMQKDAIKLRASANEVSEDIESCVDLTTTTTSPAGPLSVGKERKPLNTIDKLKCQVNKLRDQFLDAQDKRDVWKKRYDALLVAKNESEARWRSLHETALAHQDQLRSDCQKARTDLTKAETKFVFDRSRITELKCDVDNLERELVEHKGYRHSMEENLKAAKKVLTENCELLANVIAYVNGIWQKDLDSETNDGLFDFITDDEDERRSVWLDNGPLDFELSFIKKQTKIACVFLFKLGETRQHQLSETSPVKKEPNFLCKMRFSSSGGSSTDGRGTSSGGDATPSPDVPKPLHLVMHDIMAPSRFPSDARSSSSGDDTVFLSDEGGDGAFRNRSPSDSSSTNTNTDTSEETDTVLQAVVSEELVDDGTASAQQVEPQGRKFRSMSDGASGSDEVEPIDLFPSLPDSVLEKMGLLGDSNRKRLSEQEIEQKFSTLALAFTIDAATIKDRRIRQQMQRDQTEDNMASEINKLVEQIHRIKPLCIDAEKTELLQALLNQVDVIVHAAGHVSTSAERFGAVQHEDRLSDTVNLMIQHVAILKTQRDSARKQLQCTKRVLQDCTTESSLSGGRNPVMTQLNGRLVATRRRASIATITDPKENNRVRGVTRRTSDLSPRRIEVRDWTGDRNDRLQTLTRGNRPSPMKLGGDLDKIREGTVETGPITEHSMDDDDAASTHLEDIQESSLHNISNTKLSALTNSHNILLVCKEASQKYINLTLEKIKHNFPSIRRNFTDLEIKKMLTHFLYLVLICILISIIFAKDNFISIINKLFFSQGPWQAPPT